MLANAETSFARFDRLSARATNAGLLAALAEQDETPGVLLTRANLLRRSGDLAGARAAFVDYLDTGAAPPDAKLHGWSAVPWGLRSNEGFAIAPLVCIDGFLPLERMQALHAHACERETEFGVALATNIGAAPAFDPERRQTLVDYAFEAERETFLGFIDQNLAALRHAFGLPDFAIERIELKMTSHVDGGFFKTHNDNHGPFRESGRAITWLYYFGEDRPRFTGGELYICDSKPGGELLSPAWFTRVDPVPNRLIAFPSWFYHAVAPTSLANGGFAQGRFAVSSHVRKRTGGAGCWWEKDRY